MCAIAGVIVLTADEQTQRDMLSTMARRGPDGRGVYQNGDCTLLHSRLAIIDPEGGRQPMVLRHQGEIYVISYNGELYNTEELRQEMTKLGHSFEGHSDTEVVLHAYAQWGRTCVEKFNGIFAFGIWEVNSRRLFLARDRIGVKPLFFTRQQGGLIFASEIKTILAHPAVKPVLDAEGVAQVLLIGPGRVPGSGVFKGIEELKPGHYAFFEAGKLQLTQYWKLRDREHRESFADTSEHVRWLVMDSIQRQMVSDVPIGTFLSGGLDSSLITAVCANVYREKGLMLPTFSLDYEDNDRYFQSNKFQPESDSAYIRRMNAFSAAEHHWTVLTVEDLLESMDDATRARDLPGMADVDFSLLAFCRRIRPHVKVALSGECADEIFGGYPWYRDPEVRAAEGFPWAQNTAMRAQLLPQDVRQRINAAEYVMDHYRDTCKNSDILPGCSAQEKRMKEMVNLNFAWFMQTLLDRKDRMSMYTSLEVRVPFCDYRIAEYLYGVPWEYKDYRGVEKGLLRHAMQGVLPKEILYRKKSPYPKTFHPDYTQKIRQRLELVLQEADGPLFRIVDRKALRQLCDGEQPWPWYGQLMRSPQTMAYFLQLDRWLRSYGIDIAV